MKDNFLDKGWLQFAPDPQTVAWAAHALPYAVRALDDPANAAWLQCEGSWFIGVDALPNDERGQLPDGPPLAGPAVAFLQDTYGPIPPLHRAQVSSVFPGYPRPREAVGDSAGEDDAAFRYRLKRDAAHVDGVKLFGPGRRRRVDELHAWVLGVPLNQASADAAPFVVWEGSHEVMRRAFAAAFKDRDPADWGQADVTEAYKAGRAEVFKTCPRVEVHCPPGGAYAVHRLCLHGVAPWGARAQAPKEGRMIAYFRPTAENNYEKWLNAL